MNAQTPNPEALVTEAPKSRLRNPFSKNDASTTDSGATKSLKDKAGTVLKVVGVVAIAGVVAGAVAKRRGVTGVEVDLPTVDVTTESA